MLSKAKLSSCPLSVCFIYYQAGLRQAVKSQVVIYLLPSWSLPNCQKPSCQVVLYHICRVVHCQIVSAEMSKSLVSNLMDHGRTFDDFQSVLGLHDNFTPTVRMTWAIKLSSIRQNTQTQKNRKQFLNGAPTSGRFSAKILMSQYCHNEKVHFCDHNMFYFKYLRIFNQGIN